MDISFDCDSCGKHLVVDQAGAGITIDCPGCGKPVYVPSTASQSSPIRVELKSASRNTAAGNSLFPSSSLQQKSSIHPSIEAGVHCLLILVVIQFVGFVLIRQSLLWGGIFVAADMPFVIAPLLCAVYGMCLGHVRQGVLIVAALALILGGSYWLMFWPIVEPFAEMQKMFKY
jgi:hypothetical protein